MNKKLTKRRVYTKEFKAEAVALAEKKEKPVSQTAKDLGLNENMLRKWITTARKATDSGLPEFLHLETMREMSRLDEGQRLSNAKEAGIAIGEKRGEKRGRTEILDMIQQGMNPADILAKYGR